MSIDVIEQILSNMPEDWEASEESAESLCVAYVRALEKRVEALGGHRNAHDGGQTAALGAFYSYARQCVVKGMPPIFMREAWKTYARIKREAE